MSKVNVFSFNVVVHVSDIIPEEESKTIATNVLNGIVNEINSGNGLVGDDVDAFTRRIVLKANDFSLQWNVTDNKIVTNS